MTDTNDNGAGVPMVGGLPILSQACAWAWEIHEVGRDNESGEKVFIIRLRLPTGPLELWAPASFVREFGEKLVAQAAGLHLAKNPLPPNQP